LSLLPTLELHPILHSEVIDVKTRSHAFPLLSLLLIALISLPAFSSTEEDCECHDRPDTPCVRQRIVLEDVVFPAGNAAHDALYEDVGDSEVWILIETVPAGGCRACAQTYVLYAPKRDVKSDKTYHLFTGNDVALSCSKVVFSMTECTPASPLTMRIAIIEEGDSYSDSLGFLRLYLAKALLLGETGDRAPSEAEDRGWSARLDGAWLDSLVDRLRLDSANDVVLPATSMGGPTMDGKPKEQNVWNFSGPKDRWVQVKLRGESYPIGCSLRCSEEDSPTHAESHLAGVKLCAVASFAATAKPGYTEVTSGASLPTNASKVETSVKKETRTRPDGSKVEYVFIVRVIRFRDGSVYLESYSIKRVVGPDGKATETIRDCLQATSLRGFDRVKIRSLLEIADQTGVTHTLSGGSPSDALRVLAPVDAASGIEAVPSSLTIIVPSNAALDLASLAGPAGVAQAQVLAWESVTIQADEILLREGTSLETTIFPRPQVLPAEDRLALVAPEAAALKCSGDRIDVVLANLSGGIAVVSVTSSDTKGWTVPVEQDVQLAPGEATVLTFHVQPDEAGTLTETSILSVTANAEGLPHTTRVLELRCVEDGEAASEGTPEAPSVTVRAPGVTTTALSPSLPEDIESYARILAWKGGQLGRTDPSQRWSADEDNPGEFCEPCGHTPMCEVCMEWDLGEWQRHRPKSVADVVALMGLLSYLAQVSGRPEYQAVASIYWDAHWDGWHNRNRPR
jgi:hypothetical protein